MRTPKIIVDVTTEPLTIQECRSHLEAQTYGDIILDALDDAMIMSLLGAARNHAENFLGLSLAPKTLEIALDVFPGSGHAVDLPLGPVVSIVSVTGMTSGDYLIDDYIQPNQLLPVLSWPIVTAVPAAIKIRYTAGYGGANPLPKAIRSAILMQLNHLFENREAVNIGGIPAEVPQGFEALLRPLRIRLGMA